MSRFNKAPSSSHNDAKDDQVIGKGFPRVGLSCVPRYVNVGQIAVCTRVLVKWWCTGGVLVHWWCTGVLVYWWCAGGVLVYWCSGGVLVYWCPGGVLVYWCTGILLMVYWCTGVVVVLYWCTGVLAYRWWCTRVLVVVYSCTGGGVLVYRFTGELQPYWCTAPAGVLVVYWYTGVLMYLVPHCECWGGVTCLNGGSSESI